MVEQIIDNPEIDLTSYIKNSILRINQYLDIDTEILISSQIEKDNTLKAQDRIIEICKKLNADIYINPCGGRGLYRHCDFEKEGLKLFFLTTIGENIHYQQFKKEFVENLSIVDLLMNNGQNQIRNFLHQYILEK